MHPLSAGSELPPIPASPSTPQTPAAATGAVADAPDTVPTSSSAFANQPATSTPVTAARSSSASQTIQETTKTSEQVYLTHATVAAAAAVAGGLVGGVHKLDVRTAANVAEAAVDPAAVVDFDCMSPTAAAAVSAGQHMQEQAAGKGLVGEGGTAGEQVGLDAGGTAAAGQVSTGGASTEGGIAGHAVSPEDREDVAATLQRLRSAGQLQGPDTPTGASTGPSTDSAAAPNAEDSFVGASMPGAGSGSGAASAFSAAAAAGHPSAQGVSAGTAAPALAGYPDPTIGTAAEDINTMSVTAPETAPGSSSGLLAAHDAAAKAAAVAGALAHIGVAVNSAAALADTATQPAEAVEAAAEAAAAAGTDAGNADTSAVRASSLHQQHTLAEFLLDDHAVHMAATQHSADSSANATAASSLYQVDLSAGTSSVAADDDLQVQLDVGRSRRVLSPDGTVAAPAATVPEEAVAAIKASEAAEAPKSPRHPSLRQLSMTRQPDNAGSSSAQQDKPSSSGLPYGLTVADIVAATVASEERRFRVVSPRSSAGDNFFTASSSSAPSTPRADAVAVERSNSPLSASATKAIYDSVQLAVQQQQEQEQLALAVARSASLGPARGATDQYDDADAADFAVGGAGESAEASTTAQMHSAGSQDSTATSSRPSSAGSVGRAGEVPCSVDNHSPAATAVAKQNAEVMQEVMHETAGAAQGTVGPTAAAGTPVMRADTLSSDSTASQCGDVSEYQAAAALPGADAATESGPNSSSTSAGDRLAAAVAAEAADPVAAAAAGTDVAATAAPAFPSVVFGVGAMPVDLPAVSRGADSVETGPSSTGNDTAGVSEELSTAAALASTGLAALDDGSSMQVKRLPAPEDPAVQQVVDATSAAVVSSAGLDATAVAAASAAAAATELHADTPDPAVAAASAAQLVVDAASTLPGMLDPADVASAAAAAGAAAAAAATPGMDPTSAAVACAVAAADPLANPEDVAAAAAHAVASMQDSAGADEPTSPKSITAGMEGAPAVWEAGSSAPTNLGGCAGAGGLVDLTGLLPIMAPAGQVGDAIPVSSSGPSTGSTAPAQLPTVLEASESEGSSAGDGTGVGMGVQQGGMFEGTSEAGGSVEVLNREGLAKMFDPLIVQLAMATSTPLEGLGVDESALAGMDSAAAIAAAGRAFINSSSFGTARSGGSGMLLLQPHPLAGAASLGTSTGLGGGPPEGGVLQTHLAAAEEALAQLDNDSKLQRRQTDSISLGAGRSAVLGELDEAALAAVGGTAEAPAGPAEGEGKG